jgi:hypothetical protein
MTTYTLKATGPMNLPLAQQIEDQYVEWYDPEAYDGRGDVQLTSDRAKAKLFASHEEAWTFWKQISKTRPKRADGRPNRPLTAFSVSIEPTED